MGQNLNVMEPFDEPDYVYEQELGKGAFGKVYKVRLKGTNHCFALKVIKCGSNEALENVIGEMRALSKLEHPNIMKLIETKCVQKEMFMADLHLVFEYCCGGTLGKRLCRPSGKVLNLKWMRQMANAVAYIHSKSLVHRDLKPDNILLGTGANIKIGDFGLSRHFSKMKSEDETWESYYMNSPCGTHFYMAPEVFSEYYTEKADVFALGILFYAIEERGYIVLNGMSYFGVFFTAPNGSKIPLGFQMYKDKTGANFSFSNTSKNLAQLIGSTLLFDQKRRPTAAEIKQRLDVYKL